jgi:hypothetical protein
MGSVLYSDGALADGRSAQLQLGVSMLVEERRISRIASAVSRNSFWPCG